MPPTRGTLSKGVMAMSRSRSDDAGTKYSLSRRERWQLDNDLRVSDHAHEQWDARMPADARSIEHALEHATRDVHVIGHTHFRSHPRETDAVRVYRGVTATGSDYGAVMPELEDDIMTAYRIRSVPAFAQEVGMSERVGLALAQYLRVLGEQGGVVDE